jgi:hypothetical protein
MIRQACLGGVVLLLSLASGGSAQVRQPLDVWVVAPSISTSVEARSVMAKLGWTEVALRRASAAVVVVRSGLNNPLLPSYRSTCDLTHDADFQLNISGPNFHVYVFSIADDMSVRQVDHTSYKAD